jgi:hypothetical protein
MKQDLKYPIAKDKITNKLVNAKDAVNGKNCNCLCYHCEQELIAINKVTKQREHFRHNLNSNCAGSYETYIHWLAKEVFKEIDFISLPEIQEDRLYSNSKYSLRDLYNEFKLPMKFRKKLNENLINKINKRLKEVKIDKVEIEKRYSSLNGDIVVDVVLKFKNQDLFIEPFFFNPIDEFKQKKLIDINISTISINLVDFIAQKKHLYSIDELKDFISNDISSKSWKIIKNDALITENDFNLLRKKIENNSEIINYQQNLLIKIKEIEKEIQKFDDDMKLLYQEVRKLNNFKQYKWRIKEELNREIENLGYD